jgi:L,D-peptidoglycan transpeptidase YkuD (ErfK/YbiS/YcfS/YnhG family)
MKAMLGYSGLTPAKDRRQGTGKTPTGTFRLVTAFGRQPDPGTVMPYQQVDRSDAGRITRGSRPRTTCCSESFLAGLRGYVEHLWSYGVQYDYVAVMDYNLPPGSIRRGADGVRRTAKPADTRAGGGIFLHASDGTVTAGCIAIPVAQMRAIMRWLDPARDRHRGARCAPGLNGFRGELDVLQHREVRSPLIRKPGSSAAREDLLPVLGLRDDLPLPGLTTREWPPSTMPGCCCDLVAGEYPGPGSRSPGPGSSASQ